VTKIPFRLGQSIARVIKNDKLPLETKLERLVEIAQKWPHTKEGMSMTVLCAYESGFVDGSARAGR
jgi:hypothetical protein